MTSTETTLRELLQLAAYTVCPKDGLDRIREAVAVGGGQDRSNPEGEHMSESDDQPTPEAHLTLEIPAIAVFATDRITEVREPGEDAEPVDLTVTHREEHPCVEHGAKHVLVEYRDGDGGEGSREFGQPGTWLTVERPAGKPLGEVAA